MSAFHYAFKVKDIQSTRDFYNGILGCKLGDFTEHWIDFDFFGNQLSAHISSDIPPLDYCGKVDGISVPVPHFGCIVSYDDFIRIQENLTNAGVKFVVKPYTRYEGKKGEQLTMFFLDYSGNPLEFKSFKNEAEIFDRE